MNQTQYSRIHIALSPWDLTDDYNRHAGVTMLSALEHCSKPVTIHLLYDANLSKGKEKEEAYNKACYQKIADKYNCELYYHHVELPSWVNDATAINKWTPGTLMRLYLPDILPNVEKIIYLDCDIVVLTPIEILWNKSLEGKYLAACIDKWIVDNTNNRRKKYYQSLNIDLNKYFNAGVLLMNLSEMRHTAKPFSYTILSYFEQHKDLPYLDQDLLNWFCRGNYVQLDKKYNVFSWWEDALEYTNDCIIHYTIGKPWKKYNGNIDDYYWNYLIDTPWCDDKNKYNQYIRLAPDLERTCEIFKTDFLSQITGDKVTKINKTATLLTSIWNSVIHWIVNIMRKPLVKIGIIYE